MTDTEVFNRITELVCMYFEITEPELKSKRRFMRITIPRHIWHWLIKTQLRWSYPRIGEITGRDHTTIINSVHVVNESFTMDGFGQVSSYDLNRCKLITNEIYELRKYKLRSMI